MLTIKLIVTICQVANANVCKDVEMQFDGDPSMLTPYKCSLGAQAEIAKVMPSYPNWTPTRYKCLSAPAPTMKGPKIDA